MAIFIGEAEMFFTPYITWQFYYRHSPYINYTSELHHSIHAGLFIIKCSLCKPQLPSSKRCKNEAFIFISFHLFSPSLLALILWSARTPGVTFRKTIQAIAQAGSIQKSRLAPGELVLHPYIMCCGAGYNVMSERWGALSCMRRNGKWVALWRPGRETHSKQDEGEGMELLECAMQKCEAQTRWRMESGV